MTATAEPLPDSKLWEAQRSFYSAGAEQIWGVTAVPHAITGNARIAHTYARMIAQMLQAAGGGPALVVEFGGGSGRFGYLLVRHLRRLLPAGAFTYVLTDFSAERVEGWRKHPSYAPLVEDGLIDFAVFDADTPAPLELVCSGRTVGPGDLDVPVVGVANYVFDTLRHDAYTVRGGQLRRCRLALAETDGPVDVATAHLQWQETEDDGEPEPDLAPVLEHYRDTLDDTTVLVPVGGLRCLDFLRSLTSGPCGSVIADKGHRTPAELCSHAEPSVVLHSGAFSLMVNFDLLARWTRNRGGVAVLPAEPARSLVVAAFLDGIGDGADGLAAALQDQISDVGPDNWFTLRPLLVPGPEAGIEMLLASLRLSQHDPALFVELMPPLLEVLPNVPDRMKAEIAQAIGRVWDNFFPIGEPVDLALCVGLAYSSLGYFTEAVEYLGLSVKDHPDSAPSAFAMAVARRGLRDLRAATEWTDRALALEPGFSEARALRAVLVDEVAL